MRKITNLSHRTAFTVVGKDRLSVLQGLVTQDLNLLKIGHMAYALMLTSHGKFFCDMFIVSMPDFIILDVDASQRDQIIRKIEMFRLRSDLEIMENDTWFVGSSSLKIDGNSKERLCFLDPRTKEMGFRVYSKNAMEDDPNLLKSYHEKRFSLALSEGVLDMTVGKSVPVEFLMNKFNAINYEKGCYMGQELTARTAFLNELKKHIYTVKFNDSRNFVFNSPIAENNGLAVGKMKSFGEKIGLAMLNVESASRRVFIDGQRIDVVRPL